MIRTMKLRILISTLLLALGVALAPSNVAQAQEVQVTGPLANQPAVRNLRLYRQGRFQIEPNFSFGIQNEFSRPLIAGLHMGYYFLDALGIGLWGGYAVANLNTGLTDEIADRGVAAERNRFSLPTSEGFPDQIGSFTYMASLQLEFIPLRGKLAIFEKLFVDTDFYIFAGLALVGVEERADQSSNEVTGCMGNRDCLRELQTRRESRAAFAPTFGAGLSMYFNGLIGINMNWRAMPFAWNASGWDDSNSETGNDFGDGQLNSDDRFMRLNHMFTIGIVIYLPTAPTITD